MTSVSCRTARGMAVVAWSAIAGCSSLSYNQDFDPAVDFSKYKTYTWMEVAEPEKQRPRGMSELVEKRIVAAVDANLAAKGYTKQDAGPTDFVVHFMATTQEKIDFNTYYTGWGYYGWYGGSQVVADQYTEGTLIIDVFDSATKGLAWRGTATGTVDPGASAEQRNLRIQEAVAGIFQRFPPGPPKS